MNPRTAAGRAAHFDRLRARFALALLPALLAACGGGGGNSGNQPSMLVNDEVTTREAIGIAGNVLANDSDADDVLSVASFVVNGASFAAGSTASLEDGVLTIEPNGNYTFTPELDDVGSVPQVVYTTNTGATAALDILVLPASPQVCAPTNPFRDDAEGLITLGSLNSEKAWVHRYMSDAYLWYTEIPVINTIEPGFSNDSDVYASLDSFFEALKTPARTASGRLKDEFSFTYPTKAWKDLAGSGIVSGYGIEWYWDSPTPPRGIRVAYVEPGSPAAVAGILRGDVLVTADGVSADVNTQAGVDTLNGALFPSANGQNHSFSFSRDGISVNRNIVSAAITKTPVPTTQVINDGGRKVGYIVFNDHIASSEQGLIDAVNQLKTAAVDDLVLDLRYNGGGYLYIASELSYMIAGDTRTSGKNFERLIYNAKRSADNENTPFYNTSCILDSNFNCTNQQPLPTLNLSRVTVIATGSTCSASEAIINGLRGVDVEVRVIGNTTCGKPYGFTAKDNCGISYFPIEFQGVNAKGFGDYADGFSATCPVADDFSRALGDTSEGMLSAALYNLRTGACDMAAAQAARRSLLSAGPQAQPRLLRGPERENRVLLPRR